MELQQFNNSEFGSVRALKIDGKPWFVGKDVAEILSYTNPRKALSDHVDDEDKLDGVTIRDSIGREQTPILINEGGLFSLILRSQLPKAKAFKRWVTSEVLPSIREFGVYAVEKVMRDPNMLISALTAYRDELERRKALEGKVAVQQLQIEEMQPKATYYDIVLACKDLVNISVIAKDYGMSARAMNDKLHEMGIQYKQDNTWLLYQQYADKGYTHTTTTVFKGSTDDEHCKVHTKWTQAGRQFIYEQLKAIGILPVIER